MPNFTDTEGRTWTVRITVAEIKRVRAALDVDLLDLADGRLIRRLMDDPVLLCDALYVLVQPQAEEAGVSDEEFGAAMGGEAIARATEAMVEALTDFIPPRRARLIRTAMRHTERLEETALRIAEEKLESGDLEKRLEAELEETFRRLPVSGAPSTSSQGSSESTPVPSPSGS